MPSATVRRSPAEPHTRRLRRLHRAARDSASRCPQTSTSARATDHFPPGFYGPPEGLLAVNTLAACRPAGADRLFTGLNARMRGLPTERAARLCAARCSWGHWGCCVIDALVVFWLAGGIVRLVAATTACSRHARSRTRLVAVRSSFAIARTDSATSAAQPRRRLLRNRVRKISPMKSRKRNASSPMWSPAMPRSTMSARRACRGSRCFSRNAPRSRPANRSASTSARDELNFFPLIYWPIVPNAPTPSQEALARIDAYMKQGGTVLFDTRDAIMAPPGRAVNPAAPACWRCANPVLARHSRTRAGAARSRADQDVLPAAGLPRPLQSRPALGRGVAGAAGPRR